MLMRQLRELLPIRKTQHKRTITGRGIRNFFAGLVGEAVLSVTLISALIAGTYLSSLYAAIVVGAVGSLFFGSPSCGARRIVDGQAYCSP